MTGLLTLLGFFVCLFGGGCRNPADRKLLQHLRSVLRTWLIDTDAKATACFYRATLEVSEKLTFSTVALSDIKLMRQMNEMDENIQFGLQKGAACMYLAGGSIY